MSFSGSRKESVSMLVKMGTAGRPRLGCPVSTPPCCLGLLLSPVLSCHDRCGTPCLSCPSSVPFGALRDLSCVCGLGQVPGPVLGDAGGRRSTRPAPRLASLSWLRGSVAASFAPLRVGRWRWIGRWDVSTANPAVRSFRNYLNCEFHLQFF